MRIAYLAALAAALSLSACFGDASPPGTASTAPPIVQAGAAVADASGLPAPVVIADKTTLDESLGRGVNLAYKAARIACELAVDQGVIKGPTALHYQALNREVYAAVKAVDQAYQTGNAASYKVAVNRAQALVDQLLALTGKAPQ